MLEIRNRAGLILELPVDQKLSVEINSTLFDTDDIIRGSYSYPFRFGLTQNNRRFLGQGHLAESVYSPDMPVWVNDGSFTFLALLSFKTSGIYADGSLLIDMGQLADNIRNVPLREFVTESFSISTIPGDGNISLLTLAEADPNVYPVVFPPFYSETLVEKDWKPVDLEGNPDEDFVAPTTANVFYPHLGVYGGQIYGDDLIADRILVPMVYLGWLINYICKKLGFSASGSFFTNSELSRLIIFNTQSMPSAQGGVYIVEVGRHLGDYSISSFFKHLRAFLGLSIDIDTTNRTARFDAFVDIRRKPDTMDITPFRVPRTDGVEHAGTGGYVVKTFSSDIAEQENISDADLLLSDVLVKEILTPSTFSIGNKSGQVELPVGTLRMRMSATMNALNTPENPMLYTYLIPDSKEAGNLGSTFYDKANNYSPYLNQSDADGVLNPTNPFDLRFLIYWGMRVDSQGDLYPYASSVSYDSQYRVFGNLSLDAGEPDDIWTLYQKGYYEFLSWSKRVVNLFRLPLYMLSQVRPSMCVSFSLDNLVKDRYMLEKLSYELPAANGFVLAKFEGRQLVHKVVNFNTIPPSPSTQWIQIVLENEYLEYEGDVRYLKGDIVAYVWEDGLYTDESTAVNLLLNFSIENYSFDYSNDGTYKKLVEKKNYGEFLIDHRTVLFENQKIYGTIIFEVEGFAAIGIVEKIVFVLQKGQGYRLRK